MSGLNKLFWDADDNLRKPVREVLLDVSEDVKSDISEMAGSDVIIKKVMFVGSLTGVNYDDESDVDLHFLIDLGGLSEREKKLAGGYFNYYTRDFNHKDFEVYGHPLEIYIQDTMEGFVSPGVYDIEAGKWVEGPDKEKIEITREERRTAEAFLRRVKDLKSEFDSDQLVDYEVFGDKARELFNEIKEFRQKGKESAKGFLKSSENIVFKMLRRNNALETLMKLLRDVRQKRFDVESDFKGE